MFNTIGLKLKSNDFTSEQAICHLSLHLKDVGIVVVLDDDDIRENADLIVVAGGDGTLLSVVRDFVDTSIPILGVNLGRLGFLADVNLDNMINIINEVLAGKFIKERRALLLCSVFRDETLISKNLAFNDVVMHRKQDEKIIEFETYINNKFVNKQRADGIIINTATGSTAYALSSGGPIIHPEAKVLSLVPICPHTLSNRPLLVDASSEIQIKLCEENTQSVISFDAQSSVVIDETQQLVVAQYNNFINLIHPSNYDYFDILRSKLQWGSK